MVELLEPLAPSDMHHPPLSDIQWYPDGHEPVEPDEVGVEVPVEVEDEPLERQVQAEESQ